MRFYPSSAITPAIYLLPQHVNLYLLSDMGNPPLHETQHLPFIALNLSKSKLDELLG